MRVLAIGDIHGCLLQLNDLLALVKPAADDLVIALGDYVDRGPDTRGVIDRLIELKRGGMRLVCLRGNHEIMMLQARRGGRDDMKQWLSVGGLQALGSYGSAPGKAGTFNDIPREHWNFIEDDLLAYYETDRFILVHAGVHRDLDMDEQPDYMLYWEFLTDEMRHKSGKTVICGHTSQKSGKVLDLGDTICIDTYAYGGGFLTCLDAATGRYWQTDMMGRKRDGWVEYEDD